MKKNDLEQLKSKKIFYNFMNYLTGYVGKEDIKKIFYSKMYLVYLAKKNGLKLKVHSFSRDFEDLGEKTISAKGLLKKLLEMYSKSIKISKEYLILKEIEALFEKFLTDHEMDDKTLDEIVDLTEEELVETFMMNSLELKEFHSKEYDSSDKRIIEFVSDALNISNNDNVLDLCSGNGDFLVSIINKAKNLKLNGIEINEDTALISKIRLAVLADDDTEIIVDDALMHSYDNKFDKIFCEYPLGLRVDNYRVNQLNNEMFYTWRKPGLTSDWMFLNKVVTLLKPNGIAAMIITDGPLFKSMDKDCRRDLLVSGVVKYIIKLPSGVLPYTNLSANLIILSRKSERNEIKFIDASQEYIEGRLKERFLNTKSIMNLINGNDNDPDKVKIEKTHEICNTEDVLLTVSAYVRKKEPYYINPHILKDFIIDNYRGYLFLSKEQKEIENINGNYELLTLTDVNEGTISDSLIRIDDNNNKYDRYLLKDGDVIITSKGTRIKTAVAEVGNRKIIPNGNLLVLRLDTEKLNPYYLLSYLNSENGRLSLEQIQTGAKIISINPSRIEQMKISMIDKESQDLFAEKYKMIMKDYFLTQKHLNILKEQMDNLYSKEVEGNYDNE